MKLSDPLWKLLDNVYGQPYDVSVPLRKLGAGTASELGNVWEELWLALHHKGTVGVISYLAVPQLVKIGIERNLFDYNLLALCAVIEQQRLLGNNPNIPAKYSSFYLNAIEDMKSLALKTLESDTEEATKTVALSAIATAMGQVQLGKAILQLADDELLDEFLIQF